MPGSAATASRGHQTARQGPEAWKWRRSPAALYAAVFEGAAAPVNPRGRDLGDELPEADPADVREG